MPARDRAAEREHETRSRPQQVGSLAIFARCPSPRVACGAYRTRSPGVAVSSQLTNVAIAGSFSEGAQLANSLSSCGS